MSDINTTTPDILTLASRERFRRRLLISSRVLAGFLILAIFAFTIVNYNTSKLIGDKGFCYMCGLTEGKQCEPQYFSEYEIEAFGRESLIKQIAEYNAKKWPTIRDVNTPIYQQNVSVQLE